MILYASDLDRTLIFSEKFLKDYPSDCKYSPCETKDGKVISYMSDNVKEKLQEINRNRNIVFVPATTRSLEEYNRIDLGFTPKYAIIANGGIILNEDGKPFQDWEEYIKSQLNLVDAMNIIVDIEDNLDSVNYDVKIIDGRYLFFKTHNPKLFDEESRLIAGKYPGWIITRQRNKCYITPEHFSKQIALRWLWHKLNKPYIIASGDSELDLPMLALAKKAVIPDHGTLITEHIVEAGNIITGGIESPLETMKLVEAISKTK
jgi:hydroxymethylpyrimidine pyrophosphatase-like HAD family hydrolase